MKICFIGKYPPIEGGVSASNYWLASGLASRGHEIYVVTNADEVESNSRMHLGPDDAEVYEPSYPATGGQVKVFSSEQTGPRHYHIPNHNPFATKLAGLATQVVRSYDCDLIFAYYFEPYGIAAQLVSAWTGVPRLVRHAGSDLDRLMRLPEMATAHKEALRSADGVAAAYGLADRFVRMGVSRDRIFTAWPWVPAPTVFHPEAPPLKVNELPVKLAPTDDKGSPVAFDPSRPTIGIYGKVGPAKGSFDLLRALSLLRNEGLQFNFLAMTEGRLFQQYCKAIRELELSDRTWVLPFLPNWKVPSFIRTCTAVCFLERDFPIKIHTPVIAQEVFSAGGCLIVSKEIARKQKDDRGEMIDGQNVCIVDDPKVHSDLANKIRTVIEDPSLAAKIGAAGHKLAAGTEAFDHFINSWEHIMERTLGRSSTAPNYAEVEAASRETEGDLDQINRLLPWLEVVVPNEVPLLLERFRQKADAATKSDSPINLLAFSEFLQQEVSSNGYASNPQLAENCARFQIYRENALKEDKETHQNQPFDRVDRLGGRTLSDPKARSLRPQRSWRIDIAEFDYDVTPLFSRQEEPRPEIRRVPTIVGFLRTPNMVTTELKFSTSTRDLLNLCDGARTTDEILDSLADKAGIRSEERSDYDERVLSALQALYNQRVLVFTSPLPF